MNIWKQKNHPNKNGSFTNFSNRKKMLLAYKFSFFGQKKIFFNFLWKCHFWFWVTSHFLSWHLPHLFWQTFWREISVVIVIFSFLLSSYVSNISLPKNHHLPFFEDIKVFFTQVYYSLLLINGKSIRVKHNAWFHYYYGDITFSIITLNAESKMFLERFRWS